MINIFVYGTLKPNQVNYHIIEHQVINVKESFANGELYDLSLGYPAMIKGQSKVQGFLLSFDDQTVLEILDQFEDDFYQRSLIPVSDQKGHKITDAWAYLTTLEQVKQLGGILIPSGWWQPHHLFY